MIEPDTYRGPAWWPISLLRDARVSPGIRRIALIWSGVTGLAIATGILTVALNWSGVPVEVAGLTYDVTIYFPLLITFLLAVWLGPWWGAIPAFLASLFLARYSGLPWATSGLFALAGPVEIIILWGSMVTLNVHPDLPDWPDFFRFILAGLVAVTASSLAVIVWNTAHGLDPETGQRIWRGWVIGGVLQVSLILAPVLHWLGRPVRLWIDQQFHSPPRQDLDDDRSVQMIVGIMLLLILLVIQGVRMVMEDLAPSLVTAVGSRLVPRLFEIGLFAGLLLTTILATTGVFAAALARLSVRERRVSMRDGLTGCYNRRAFYGMFQKEADRSRRLSRGITVIALDIDGFKAVNDTHGHEVGDALLRHVVRRIQIVSREEDSLFRWGGEEFLVLLPHTNPEMATLLAERIRTRIAADPLVIETGSDPIPATVSLGVAGSRTYPIQPDDLISRADAACYLAKARGKNRVAVDPGAGTPDTSLGAAG